MTFGTLNCNENKNNFQNIITPIFKKSFIGYEETNRHVSVLLLFLNFSKIYLVKSLCYLQIKFFREIIPLSPMQNLKKCFINCHFFIQ